MIGEWVLIDLHLPLPSFAGKVLGSVQLAKASSNKGTKSLLFPNCCNPYNFIDYHTILITWKNTFPQSHWWTFSMPKQSTINQSISCESGLPKPIQLLRCAIHTYFQVPTVTPAPIPSGSTMRQNYLTRPSSRPEKCKNMHSPVYLIQCP